MGRFGIGWDKKNGVHHWTPEKARKDLGIGRGQKIVIVGSDGSCSQVRSLEEARERFGRPRD